VAAAVILAWALTLVARRRLDLRYAALWLGVAVLLAVGAAWPEAVSWVARRMGFEVPANMLFFLGFGLLLVVSLHLSVELTRMEWRLERLAGELAVERGLGARAPEPGGDSADE
jgi:hypothetical protein